MTPTPYELGQAQAYFAKYAGDAKAVYSLTGELYASKSGWVLLSVPNSLVRGAFDALHETGAELPFNSDGQLNAHISVIRPSEIEQIGGVDKIQERGKRFTYNLGPLMECEPDGWDEYGKVWFLQAQSPELKALRKSYGLSPLPNDNRYDFHVTVARRRKKVLQHNEVTKQSDFETENAEAKKRDQSSVLPHVRDGYVSCGGCHARYHVTPPDNKCPACGHKISWLRSVRKSAVDLIPGGLSDDRPASAFPPASVRQGQRVESEHTSSPAVAREIARDHLTEDPRYYDKLELVEQGGPILDQLLRAKALSDRGDYPGKHRVLSRLIRQSPTAFAVDDPLAHHPGVTHAATGFRFHVPAGLAGLIRQPKQARIESEYCPHCEARLERSEDGRCNRCGKPWPLPAV